MLHRATHPYPAGAFVRRARKAGTPRSKTVSPTWPGRGTRWSISPEAMSSGMRVGKAIHDVSARRYTQAPQPPHRSPWGMDRFQFILTPSTFDDDPHLLVVECDRPFITGSKADDESIISLGEHRLPHIVHSELFHEIADHAVRVERIQRTERV